jgi:hypothetical protein
MPKQLQRRKNLSPSPGGEGRDEGERDFCSLPSTLNPELFVNLITREYAGISGIKREAADFRPA